MSSRQSLPEEAKMRVLLTTCASVALLITAIPSARADDVPALNIERTCQGIASQATDPGERGGPDLSFNQCIKSELQIRNKLMSRWPNFSAAQKTECLGEMNGLEVPSYTDLLTCLETAQDTRKLDFPPPPSIER
jgi:hypothetical protein